MRIVSGPPWRRLVCIGQATSDVVALVDGRLASGDQTTGVVTRQFGGTAAIVAHNAASLRLAHVVFSGHAGADAAGRAAASALAGAGVEIGELIRTPHSPQVVVLVDADGERTMIAHPQAPDWSALRPRFGPYDFVFFEGWHLFDPGAGAYERLVEDARSAGAGVAIDVCSATRADDPVAHGARIAALADVVIANKAEASAMRLEPSLAHDRVLIVHAGAEPTRVWASGRRSDHPVPHRTVVDTTGAGDAFAGGMLAALVAGQRLDDAIAVGHHLGGNAVERVGAIADVSHAALAV